MSMNEYDIMTDKISFRIISMLVKLLTSKFESDSGLLIKGLLVAICFLNYIWF